MLFSCHHLASTFTYVYLPSLTYTSLCIFSVSNFVLHVSISLRQTYFLSLFLFVICSCCTLYEIKSTLFYAVVPTLNAYVYHSTLERFSADHNFVKDIQEVNKYRIIINRGTAFHMTCSVIWEQCFQPIAILNLQPFVLHPPSQLIKVTNSIEMTTTREATSCVATR
jgi:hypothetical protein